MCRLWSNQRIHSTWRKLWVALAEAEHELGLPITKAQIAELQAAVDEIDFDRAAQYERELRHDVMAHVHAYRDRCPNAGKIIHLGATSCYVTDNTDLILMREGLEILRGRLVAAIDALATFAAQARDLACLGFTHLQPAQPTTVGKRATLWCYDLVLDLEEIEHRLATLKFRGVKGTTGTQASFLALFDGDHAKVETLDRRVAEKMGFRRKLSRHRANVFAQDRRTGARRVVGHRPVGPQGGDRPADPAKPQGNRRAVRDEADRLLRDGLQAESDAGRTHVLAGRFAISLAANADQTAATQWLERTLDDSANRRLSLPQSFLAIDAVLILYRNIVDGLVVHPKVIEKNLRDELPFMATEEILMAGVRAGGDRQVLHERIRVHSQEAARRVKDEGEPNDLIDRLKADPGLRGRRSSCGPRRPPIRRPGAAAGRRIHPRCRRNRSAPNMRRK